MQHPFVLQRVVAAALGWPISRVRIIAPDPGGGFGGKGWPKFEPLMAYLALRTGRPVRLVLTLEETFQAGPPDVGDACTRAPGFSRDGRIVFQDIGRQLPARRLRRHRRPRRQQGQLRRVRAVPHAERARHRARAAVAHDAEHRVSRVRHAAGVLGRRVAAQRSGAARSASTRSRSASATCRRKARRSSRTTRRPMASGRRRCERGREASAGISRSGRAAAAAFRSASRARRPRRRRSPSCGCTTTAARRCCRATSDMGQGARTVLAQIAAQELGIDLDEVAVVMGDTAVVPFDSSTSASRSTVFMGNAIVKACARHQGPTRGRWRPMRSTSTSPRSRSLTGVVRLPDRESVVRGVC